MITNFLKRYIENSPDESPGRDEIRIEKLLYTDFRLIGNRSTDRALKKGFRIFLKLIHRYKFFQ